MTKGLSPLVGVVLAVVLLAACSGGGEPRRNIYGNPPAIEEYLTMLEGTDLLANVGDFFFRERSVPSEEQYTAIVKTHSEQGLGGLSADDRQSLLLIAQMAFLAHADTLRYSVTAGRGKNESGGATATAEEVYVSHPPLFLAARRTSGTAIEWPWQPWAYLNLQAPEETVEFFEYAPADQGDPEVLTATGWHRRQGQWTCFRESGDPFSVAIAYGFHYDKFRSFALGDPTGEDTLEGQVAYGFEGETLSKHQLSYWLDAETLWLRQYEYEDDGIHYTVKLEAVNEDIVIEPPDVDVECVEEQGE